jgi:hypothetical protein
MKCPSCNQDFKWTWRRYIKAPFGKFSCPNCHTRLIGKHCWFYWPLLILLSLICLLTVVQFILSALFYYGLIFSIIGCIIGSLLIILPFDKFLESKFCILKLDKKYSDTKLESDAANKPNGSS